MIDWLDAAADWPLDIPRLHRFRLVASEPAVRRAAADDDEPLDVKTEYFWRVDQAEPLGSSAWSDLAHDEAESRERFLRLQAAAPHCDAAVVFSLARRRGWNWFGTAK